MLNIVCNFILDSLVYHEISVTIINKWSQKSRHHFEGMEKVDAMKYIQSNFLHISQNNDEQRGKALGKTLPWV